VVFQNSGNGVITLSGVHDIEPNADRLVVYTGTPGNLIAQVGNFTGIGGGYNIVSPPGVALTAIFTSDGAHPSYGGFVMNSSFGGDCNGCLGLPTPGNTLSSISSTCVGNTVNLTLQNTTPGNGVLYQWQQAASANGTYTDIPNATAATYSPVLEADTWYRAKVSCLDMTATSVPVAVTAITGIACYCTPLSQNGCAANIVVGQITLNTLHNDSGYNCTNNSGYSNYTSDQALTTTLQPGTPYNMSVTSGSYPVGVAAWIDFNDDGYFSDLSERITSSPALLSNFVAGDYPVTIPCSASSGTHRFRIRVAYNTPGPNIPSCGEAGLGYGEVEDYMVTILPSTCATAAVNLKLFIEGYYIGAGLMNPVKMNQDYVSEVNLVEDMLVELHNPLTYETVASTTAMLHTDGTMTGIFATAPAGSYYIVVKGSNIIQTWSANPVTINNTAPVTYDFTTSASQAYGDNMRDMGDGSFAIYSGDFNHDDIIDPTDYSQWEIDFNNFSFGVFATDLNGDGIVDPSDYAIWELNFNKFIFAFYPI